MLLSFVVRNFVLPWVSRLTTAEFWPLYQSFVANPRATIFCSDPDAAVNRMKVLLDHAGRNVPFYRERLRNAGLTPSNLRSIEDLSLLPPTTKADISANFPDRIVDATESFRPWRYRATSGTIDRLTVIHDFRKRDVERAAGLYALTAATGYRPGLRFLDIPPDVCRNVCGASNAVEPGALRFLMTSLIQRRLLEPETISDLRGLVYRQLIERRTTLSSFGDGGASQSDSVKRHYLEQIAKCRPYLVKGLPVYLYVLAMHLIESGAAPPRIQAGIMPMGGSASTCMRKRIQAAFSCPVHEDYGTAELGSIAAECGAQSGLHPFSGLFHVEVVCDGRRARPGETGKVLVTDLYNFAMPFIRYEVGDLATVVAGPCSCGLKDERFVLQGRFQDAILTGDGRWISSDTITDQILSVPGVYLFQLDIHPGNDVDVQIVAVPGTTPNLRTVQEAVALLFPRDARITCRLVSTILPEPGGKYRLVRNSALAPAGCIS